MANSQIIPGTTIYDAPPKGYVWLVDSQGNYIVDAQGNRILVMRPT